VYCVGKLCIMQYSVRIGTCIITIHSQLYCLSARVISIRRREYKKTTSQTPGTSCTFMISNYTTTEPRKFFFHFHSSLPSSSSYSFIRGCQTQPTTYGTKNRCRHIHGHTHNTRRLKYFYTHSRTVFSSSYYGWCRLEMRET